MMNGGSGDNIKLDVFYRMCDELVAEAKKNTELINTDESRFDERFRVKPEDLFADHEKHMLIFDIIYCCSVYDLFDGISFTRPKTKEKQLYAERKKKAQQLLEDYNNALSLAEQLSRGKDLFLDIFKSGSKLKHKNYGTGTVKEIDEKYIVINFPEQEKKLGVSIAIVNGIITSEDERFISGYEHYASVLKREESITSRVGCTKNALMRISTDEMIAVELKKTHKMIGNVYLGKRDFNTLEIGYVFNKNYWRNGYAKESCKALIDNAFSEGIHRIFAECDPKNPNSWKLLEKLGFQKEAYFRQNVYFWTKENGTPIWKDTYVYSILNK